MSETPSLIGQEISGCEILNKIAEGGMGAVYKARHKALNRIVCVKILSPALASDKKAVELFLTEARAIAELDHPNIVNVYNVGKEKGYYFIVMSFIEGQTLSTMLKQKKVIPVGTVLDLFDGVLQGLAAAHEKGIIHRDIKPSNILINPQGQAKVVDFGIAKKVDKDKGSTKTTELAGTAYFIAPEQALGRDLDTRADLYSIGASMYYVLTGRFPYSGKNTVDIIQKHINEPVPDPLKLRKDLPAWLSLAVQKLMSKNPDNRFQTAKETYMYFRKMRAEDQLRVRTNNTGRAIDLGEEGPLKLANDEKLITENKLRVAAAQPAQTATPTTNTQPSLMPQLDTLSSLRAMDSTAAASAPAAVNPTADLLDASNAPDAEYHPAKRIKSAQAVSQERVFKRKIKKMVVSLGIVLPVFTVLAGLLMACLHHLGALYSTAITPNSSFTTDLLTPFLAGNYSVDQMKYAFLSLLLLGGVFAINRFKLFSRTIVPLLLIAFVAYLSGLFMPQAPWMDLSPVSSFLFSKSYYFAYLLLAIAWAWSLYWVINRSAGQRLLAGALTVLCMILAYGAFSLSIPPDSATWCRAILYLSLLCNFWIFYQVVAKNAGMFQASVLLPLCILGLWVYMVSGAAKTIQNTMEVITTRTKVHQEHSNRHIRVLEQELGVSNKLESFASLNTNNELADLSDQEAQALIEPQLDHLAPGAFDVQTKPLFLSLTTHFYKDGSTRMNMAIWAYALRLPIQDFNEQAKQNHIYFFVLFLLYLFGCVSCAGRIVFGEDYE